MKRINLLKEPDLKEYQFYSFNSSGHIIHAGVTPFFGTPTIHDVRSREEQWKRWAKRTWGKFDEAEATATLVQAFLVGQHPVKELRFSL